MGTPQIAHPDVENFTPHNTGGKNFLEPIYPSTEKLKAKGINGNTFAKFTKELLQRIAEKDLPENLPDDIVKQFKLKSKDKMIE